MQMTENEIRRNYRQAKHPKRQIGILADLNDCSRRVIEEVLGLREPKIKPSEQATSLIQTFNKAEVSNLLFDKLDALEKAIKELEDEYRRTVSTLEVINADK